MGDSTPPTVPVMTTVYQPTKPKMGGVEKQSDSSFTAWTGGQPNPKWLGLKDPTPSTIMATQYRPTSIGSATKGQHYRTLGVEPKFTRKTDLLTFQKKFMDHLKQHGMDTITYLSDPGNVLQTVSVVNQHAQFTLKEAMKSELDNQAGEYDEYDKANSRDAKASLLKSLDESLLTQMYENCGENDSFITYWMNLMLIVGSISIERFDKIKDSIKKRKIQGYSGQDVESISTDYISEWKQLHSARMYDHSLTLTMLKAIMEAGNEDFRYGLRSLKEKLSSKLLEIRHLSYDDAHKEMVHSELDVQSVLKYCKQEYRTLLDDGKWPAASHAKDSKAIPRNYGNVNIANADELTKLIANALIQGGTTGVRDKSKDRCGNCGQNGHWARDCTKPRNDNRRPMGRGRGGTGRGQGRGGPGRGQGRGNAYDQRRQPKFPPPRNGESEIKTVEGGKKYYWCSKCNNWTVSHGTDAHKTKEELRASMANDGGNRYDFAQHPVAFMITDSPTTIDLESNRLTAMSANLIKGTKKQSILFDSGANCCITNDPTDFVSDYSAFTASRTIEGMGKALKADGHGHVAWSFKADDGSLRTLTLPAYLIQSAQQKIASTSQILHQYPDEKIEISQYKLKLYGSNKEPPITVKLCPKMALPLAQAHTAVETASARGDKETPHPLGSLKSTPSVTAGANFNLTEPEKELLRWHYRLGHVSMKRVQWMFRQGFLANSEKAKRSQRAAVQLTSGPLCTACQYAKQRLRSSPGTTTRSVPADQGLLKQDRLFPGQQVSVDHFYSNPHGRLLNTYGKEATDKKYTGGCIFVDHASSFVDIELQSHLNSHETLNAKKAFENRCSDYGVVIQEYLSDNGTAFRNKDFEAHLKRFHQTVRHSGVGAHHSNGIAERNIATVMAISRAILHHAAIHWPDVADVELWPLAVLHAVYLLNRIPKQDTGQSALELFTRTSWPRSKFHDFHVWGSPVYVLDGTISDGKKIPRWKPRSGRHVYVGAGPTGANHSHSIPLILSLDTGKITPQYHIVFDDWFNTVSTTDGTPIDFNHPDWYQTFGLTEYQYILPDSADDDEDARVQRELLDRSQDVHTQRELLLPPGPLEMPHPAQRIPEIKPALEAPLPELAHSKPPPTVVTAPVEVTPIIQEAPAPVPPPPQREEVQSAPPSSSPQPKPRAPRAPKVVPPPSRRSQRLLEAKGNTTMLLMSDDPRSLRGFHGLHRTDDLVVACVEDNPSILDPMLAFWATWTIFDPLAQAHAAKSSKDPDTLTWDEAMRASDRVEWLAAADLEIRALEAQGTWTEDLKSNATTKIIPSQWVNVYKRAPSGDIKKRKSRIVLRGDLQDYTGETFSPVAAWSTVRSFLVASDVMNRITCTIDFSNAFVQSPLPESEPVWMHVPRGYRASKGDDYCLKLNKSLYGHKVAPLLWFKHIGTFFTKLGLVQSTYDPCLWYGTDIMLVQYVDDCGISSTSQENIDKFIASLRKEGLVLTQEESFSEFLGIEFEVRPDGTHVMTQRGLIKKVLSAARMEDCNPNSTPASQTPLGADKDGEPMDETWSYRAIVGMLLYLSGNTRPDIAFAVSQVARFSHDPKKSHASAIKTILRYLKGSANSGTMVVPSTEFKLDLWVDADFAGLFGVEDPLNPNSVRSRTGYVIKFCNWPILWKSQLQTHISQSTTEAEYSALSFALKTMLPLKWLLEEMLDQLNTDGLRSSTINANVFEDNQSAYYLAVNQRLTNRTKYFSTKFHWFWSHAKAFTLNKCPTNEMQADFLTKSLAKDKFLVNRKYVMGW